MTWDGIFLGSSTNLHVFHRRTLRAKRYGGIITWDGISLGNPTSFNLSEALIVRRYRIRSIILMYDHNLVLWGMSLYKWLRIFDLTELNLSTDSLTMEV